MEDLIAELESVKEGTMELDCRIHSELLGLDFCSVLGSVREGETEYFARRPAKEGDVMECQDQYCARSYSNSLDAALDLVPTGWTVARIGQNDDKTWTAELREGLYFSYSRVVFGPSDHKAPTPALALAIAALKARLG